MAAAIETKQLTKTYKSRIHGQVNVVDHLDLHVEEGEIFGFLGPNGAGKTTTIKMLLGIIYPSQGEGYVLGKEIGDIDIHRLIAYVPERPYYYEYMTGLELLKFYGSLFGVTDQKKFVSLMERVGLQRDLSKTISQYSKGMQQRIGLAQALINDPKLLFLDEPTGGLDPIAHREIRDLILSFRDEGRTVFISSHELSEVELICDRVAIIDRGEVQRQGPLTELLKGGRIELTLEGMPEADIRSLGLVDTNVRTLPRGFLVDMPETNDLNSLIDTVRAKGGSVSSVIPRKKRLEDLFVETVTSNKGANSQSSTGTSSIIVDTPAPKKKITMEDDQP